MIIVILFFDYDFNNYIINGIVLYLTSISLTVIFYNQAFYIETGMQVYDKKAKDQILLYSNMHPFLTFYNKIIGVAYLLSSLISIILVIVGIASYFKLV